MSTFNDVAYTAVQKRWELEQKYFPNGMSASDIRLLTDVEQLIIKAYEAGASQDNEQAWSNQSALGYLIMAARRAALPKARIQQLVNCMKSQFDTTTLNEASTCYCESDF